MRSKLTHFILLNLWCCSSSSLFLLLLHVLDPPLFLNLQRTGRHWAVWFQVFEHYIFPNTIITIWFISFTSWCTMPANLTAATEATQSRLTSSNTRSLTPSSKLNHIFFCKTQICAYSKSFQKANYGFFKSKLYACLESWRSFREFKYRAILIFASPMGRCAGKGYLLKLQLPPGFKK